MKYILFILLCMPVLLYAQDESKYLEGTVPVVNNKVTFSETINAPLLSQDQLYSLVQDWSNEYFVSTKEFQNRILYSNPEKGELACQGQRYLTFADRALTLDRAMMNYRMIFICTPGKCEVKITNIRYQYDNQNLSAEDMITDEQALNKNKDKLFRQNGKFRIHTVDFVNELLASIASVINPVIQAPTIQYPGESSSSAIPENSLPTTSPAPASLVGYKQIYPEQIPGNIIKILSQDWMLVTAGNAEKFNMMTASWGGLGYLYEKPVAFCFINQGHYTYQLMESSDTYTLTFYTEAYRDALKFCGSNSGRDTDKVKATGLTPITTPEGSQAFSEAWMIIECRKMVAQTIVPEAILPGVLPASEGSKQLHKMYIGEIIHVWVK